MGLTDPGLQILVVALCLIAPVVALLVWTRVRGPMPVRWLQRLVLVLMAQLLAVMAAFVTLNNQFQFYVSWHDLLGIGGSDVAGATVISSSGPATDPRAAGSGVDGGNGFAQVHSGDRSQLVAAVAGSASGIIANVYVWLPPQYHDPSYARTRFPVIELFSGFPGSPSSWLHALHIGDVMNTEIAHGMHPFVLVIPTINVAAPRDTECTDFPGGPKVATFLAQDVPQMLINRFRVRADPRAWAAMGYSTGGFCAEKLALQYPQRFHTAVSMSGYAQASSDMFNGLPVLQRRNSPGWLIAQRPAPDINLLLLASAEDGTTAADARYMAANAALPTRVTVHVVPTGGHNARVWSAELPYCLQWLSTVVQGPEHG